MLKLYNTLTRKKQIFKPLQDNLVTMYNCGPTVYNYAHIGNFRAYVFSDILKRYLLYKGYKVRQVMNITDVDDKTIRESQKEGTSLKAFTEFYTKAFFEDLDTLNISKADVYPKATEHIPEMIALIQTLLKEGYAYTANDGIYFNIQKFRKYGKLSRIQLDKEKTGVRVATDEYDKEHVQDFALWKFWDEKDGDVVWHAPFGRGRPGWHIECSAMSLKYLGNQFDIHTGGIDLIFPHHENEIAQSVCCGYLFVKFWLHNEYLLVYNKKMSKSLGNFYTLRDLIKQNYKPKSIRYALLSCHYRQPLNFTLEGLQSANHAVQRLQELVDKLKIIAGSSTDNAHQSSTDIVKLIAVAKKKFEQAMDDDLNTATALGDLFEFVKEINKRIETLAKKDAQYCLDFFLDVDRVLAVVEVHEKTIPQDVLCLVQKREEARHQRDFSRSDQLRQRVNELGYKIDDTKDGQSVKKI